MKVNSNLWAIFFAFFAISQNASGEVPTKICAAAYLNVDGKAEMAFTIENASSQPIKFLRDELPGAFPYSINIFLLKRNGEIVKQIMPVVGVNPDRVLVLDPGERHETRFLLMQRFPDVEKLRKREKISIFWSYQAQATLDEKLTKQPRVGGWLEIKETRAGDCPMKRD